MMTPALAAVEALDREDTLAAKREQFALPKGLLYLNGNSLGVLPHGAAARATKVVEQEWGVDLVRGWNTRDWINLPTRVGEQIARLIGAAPGQTLCCDSTSINLYKLLAAALAMQPERRIVLTERDNFPADLYIAQGLVQGRTDSGIELKTVPATDIEAQLDESVAVLMLTHVNYKTAAMHNMEHLTRLAHDHGILVLWDLAHSAGAVPLALDSWEVDFAVGCGYKYLNGGPGAPGFLYAATRHHEALRSPLTGWMGHASPFEFAAAYEPASGIQQFACGTPPVVSMSVLSAALEVFAGIDMQDVRRKSVALSELCLQCVETCPELQTLRLESPAGSAERGSHLAFSHPHAYAICQALAARNVICDFRAPATLRLGFAPLYLQYRDVWDSVDVLGDILRAQRYLAPEYAVRKRVT